MGNDQGKLVAFPSKCEKQVKKQCLSRFVPVTKIRPRSGTPVFSKDFNVLQKAVPKNPDWPLFPFLHIALLLSIQSYSYTPFIYLNSLNRTGTTGTEVVGKPVVERFVDLGPVQRH